MLVGAGPAQDLRTGAVVGPDGQLRCLLKLQLVLVVVRYKQVLPIAQVALLDGVLIEAAGKRSQPAQRAAADEVGVHGLLCVPHGAPDRLDRACAVPEGPTLQEHGDFGELVVVADDVAEHGLILAPGVFLLHDLEVPARFGQQLLQAVAVVEDRWYLGQRVQPPHVFAPAPDHDELGLRRQGRVHRLLGLLARQGLASAELLPGLALGVLVGVHEALHHGDGVAEAQRLPRGQPQQGARAEERLHPRHGRSRQEGAVTATQRGQG
mmetsp:Transcript_34265/g.106380  ORF Transcript_34265/g.106380 Transcript_34265/m.106380 type:complete len:266 (+) Transcript_34265:1317-2114(+)